MAAPTITQVSQGAGSNSSYKTVGNREDLEDIIYKVAPEETPLSNNLGSVKAKSYQHDWQVRGLAAPNASNAQLEGDDVTAIDAPNLTSRLSATCQIFRKTGSVSGTQEAMSHAGVDSDLADQKIQKGAELKRDVEARMIGNYGSKVDESGGTGRQTAGFLAWLTSNTTYGTGGANGGFAAGVVTAATNGTASATNTSEANLKAVMSSIFSATGSITDLQVYMGPGTKQKFAAFTGLASWRVTNEVGKNSRAEIIGAADVYRSDFGVLTFIPHAYGLSRDALFVNPAMAKIATFRPTAVTSLSMTGDNMKFTMVAEKALEVCNEKAHGVMRDLA